MSSLIQRSEEKWLLTPFKSITCILDVRKDTTTIKSYRFVFTRHKKCLCNTKTRRQRISPRTWHSTNKAFECCFSNGYAAREIETASLFRISLPISYLLSNNISSIAFSAALTFSQQPTILTESRDQAKYTPFPLSSSS